MDVHICMWNIALFSAVFLLGTSASSVVRQYCQDEILKTSCAEDEVILIHRALYGRMSLGRCIRKDISYIGCAGDVLSTLHDLCSGRRTCTVPVRSTFRSFTLCPQDLQLYLDVAYSCVKVETGDGHGCTQHSRVKAEMPSGFLSGVVAAEKGLGTPECPWLIQAKPGQRINITVHEFAVVPTSNTSDTGHHEVCYLLGIIRERPRGRSMTICRSSQGKRHTYLSESNSIDLYIGNTLNGQNGGYFLIEYEAIGCPDLDPVQHANMVRRGDIVRVTCQSDATKTWILACLNSKWIGEIGECPAPGA